MGKMGRNLKYNADFFPHDADMRNDSRLLAVRNKFGHVGYSVWIMLLESLANKDGFVLDWDNLDIELMAGDFRTEVDELENIISYLAKLNLIVIKDKTLHCPKLIKRLQPLLDTRKRKRSVVSAVHNSQATELCQDKPVRNTQSKVKESKVKESKVNLSLKKEKGNKQNSSSSENIKIVSNFVEPNIEDVANEFANVNIKNNFGFDNTHLITQSGKLFEYYKGLKWCYPNSKTKITDLNKLVTSWLTKDFKSKKDANTNSFTINRNKIDADDDGSEITVINNVPTMGF